MNALPRERAVSSADSRAAVEGIKCSQNSLPKAQRVKLISPKLFGDHARGERNEGMNCRASIISGQATEAQLILEIFRSTYVY